MDANAEPLLLTTSGVADLLGVHTSTVKRWCDEGSLPSVKTNGGHRRIHLRELLALARERGIVTFLDPFHPWEANVWLGLSAALHEGSFRRLQSLALSWLSQGESDLLGRLMYEIGRRPEIPFTRFLDDFLRGFMWRVGEEWRQGRLQVGEEHMATQVVHEVLVRLRTGWDRLEAGIRGAVDPLPVAIVGSMEGDHHDLGAQAIRVFLEREGWRVYYLGANVPVEDFSAIQLAQGASLVCVSFSPTATLPDLQRAVRILGEFYRPAQPYALALGGAVAGVSPDQVPAGPFPSFSVSGSVEEFAAWVRSLHPAGEMSEPRRVA